MSTGESYRAYALRIVVLKFTFLSLVESNFTLNTKWVSEMKQYRNSADQIVMSYEISDQIRSKSYFSFFSNCLMMNKIDHIDH